MITGLVLQKQIMFRLFSLDKSGTVIQIVALPRTLSLIPRTMQNLIFQIGIITVPQQFERRRIVAIMILRIGKARKPNG